MFELHIEFNNDSLVLQFEDIEDADEVCHSLKNVSGFLKVYSEGMIRFINTRNILYFYVVKVNGLKSNKEDGDF